MGQRTAIIVQHVNNYKYNNDMRKTATRVYYHQWGIGRILPSHLLSVINAMLSVSTYRTDTVKRLQPQGTLDITNLDNYRQEDLDLLDTLNFDKPEEVGRIICGADNNNGGIFVRITTNAEGNDDSIEYAYMLGCEEDGDYKHFCTEDEWMSHNTHYIDKKWRTIYDNTISYFGAIQRNEGEVKKCGKAAL